MYGFARADAHAQGEDLKNLKLLNVFEPCTLQVGDRNFLTIGAEDTFISKQQWRKQQSKYYRSIRKQTRPSKKSSKESAEHMPGLSKSHVHSPEPHKGDCLHNGDSKAELALNDDDSDNWENTSSDGSDTDSGATWSSRCSSAASQRGKRSPQLAVRLLRGKRLKRTARRAPPAPPPRLGDRVVVETLHTTSRANVVWQLKHREYGVVQRVDHHGRTAIVHWPQMLHESEMSVYDLKDHPDFQYRPGTVVIRVANFTGEDANCTAGQVGEYDSEEGELWGSDGSGSEDSWETQSSAHDGEPRTPATPHHVQASESLQRLPIPGSLDGHLVLPRRTLFWLGLLERVRERGASTPRAGERRVHEQLAPATEPTDVDGTTRNVCYKLCSLIHSQLVKAHAEVSRRRPQELAAFLNSLMEKQNVNEEKLPYHFTVQYGALVVSMADQAGEGEPTEGKAGEGKDATIIVPALADGAPAAPTDTAPLATAEPVDVEPLPAIEVEGGEGFCILEAAPAAHRFRLSMLQPSEPRTFYSAVWVRGFEDRIDLLSLMIAGPTKTPYEGGLFVFDVQLGGEYPRAPPLCHYHSYCTDRLNPNLYEDGKGLILNAEPYFNEAGYEKQKGTQQGKENSRMYNEMVLLKLVQSMTKDAEQSARAVPRRDTPASPAPTPPPSAAASRAGCTTSLTPPRPTFPLIPAPAASASPLRSSLESFRKALRRHDIPAPAPANAYSPNRPHTSTYNVIYIA
ncbi:hypothetical protein MSG28_003995 [Choristoneura fumiferana]|uniref:Uncharacterized protein n=1 Tax=Choristoneura fumiferana TaxID=7141 RepID=A0ACC0KHH6_CHOFU|nr:hypothetical protein MSG28_003995 [Choristoneura fumiferana]